MDDPRLRDRGRPDRAPDEGECRIKFEKMEYDVTPCPWLDGSIDHQEDVFKVVSGRQTSNVSDRYGGFR